MKQVEFVSLLDKLHFDISHRNFNEAYATLERADPSSHRDSRLRALAYELLLRTRHYRALAAYLEEIKKLGVPSDELARTHHRYLYESERYEEASDFYNSLSQATIKKDLTVELNHALTLSKLGQYKDAASILKKLQKEDLKGRYSEVWLTAGIKVYLHMRDQGLLVLSKRILRQLLWSSSSPTDRKIINFIAMPPWKSRKWGRTPDRLTDVFPDAVSKLGWNLLTHSSLFYSAYAIDNPLEDYQSVHKIYSKFTQIKWERARNGLKRRVCLYLSEPQRHVSKWLLALWEELALTNVEVDIISTKQIHASSLRLPADTTFLVLESRSSEEILNIIRRRKYDLIAYSDVGMDIHTRYLSNFRLANVQVCHWGHPVSTGSCEIDYFVTSELMEPVGGENRYQERLVTLPGVGIYIKRKWYLVDLDINRNEAKGVIIANSLFKTDGDFVNMLNKISKAYFVECGETLRVDVISSGIEDIDKFYLKRFRSKCENIHLVQRLTHERYLEEISNHIVNIDTPWSGGNTTLDCLSVGVPTLTMSNGKYLRTNHTYAINTTLGLNSLCYGNAEDLTQGVVDLLLSDATRQNTEKIIRESFSDIFERKEVLNCYRDFLAEILTTP